MSVADRNKWNAKYSAVESVPSAPSEVLKSLANYLPQRGRALDLAGGAGRNAIWLAQRGLQVTIWDVSATGLALARQRTTAVGVSLQTVVIDLEAATNPPSGAFDLVLCVCYLHRPIFAWFSTLLAPGGTLAVIQPTLSNLQRHDKPPADFLLQEGELPRLVQGLEIIHVEEGWLADGRHDAVVVARKSAAAVV